MGYNFCLNNLLGQQYFCCLITGPIIEELNLELMDQQQNLELMDLQEEAQQEVQQDLQKDPYMLVTSSPEQPKAKRTRLTSKHKPPGWYKNS